MGSELYGAIEAGGTKFVLAVATAPTPDAITDQIVVPTETPSETLDATYAFFEMHRTESGLRSVGIGTFGPVNLEQGADYGRIVTTPKPGWSGVSLTEALAPLEVPVIVDTDVNAAALAESKAMGVERLVYYTIGTGIGGGLVVDGSTVTGRPHTEAGHMSVERMAGDDYAGHCPYHGACAEGMTAGPAIEDRFGVAKGTLSAEIDRLGDQVIPLAAWYIAQIAVNANFMIAPDRVVLGGGIMGIPGLFDATAAETTRRINGYTLRTADDPEWLVTPSLGTDSGITGSLLLAEQAATLTG